MLSKKTSIILLIIKIFFDNSENKKIIIVCVNMYDDCLKFMLSEAGFKEFEPRLKFKTRLKQGWFHLRLNSVFRDFSGQLI